ncbi:MAG TPA: hypothetical protein VNI54_11145 [Thermoanaerobaculia bacterium]|nr:hypothetical protein [Thermoanaerobaculia bacterium]
MRKLGVAAALILCAFGASASNFRAADQVYVPIAGRASGSSGLFTTDAYISNLSGDSVDVSVIYVPRGDNAGGTAPAGLEEIRGRITLRPYERKEFPNIFESALGKPGGFGLLIFNGCRTGLSCGTDTQDNTGFSANFRPIAVQTRIYQVTPQRPLETTGQLFSGIPWYHFVSRLQSNVELDKVFITGLSNTGGAGTAQTYRANIGAVNASEWNITEIVFTLYQGTLTDADKKAEAVRAFGPLGNQLYGFDELFRQPSGDVFRGTNYFVVVSQRGGGPTNNPPEGCVDGCPAFLAYGSVLDNLSGDATTMEAQYMVPLSEDVLDVMYPQSSGKKPVRRTVRH